MGGWVSCACAPQCPDLDLHVRSCVRCHHKFHSARPSVSRPRVIGCATVRRIPENRNKNRGYPQKGSSRDGLGFPFDVKAVAFTEAEGHLCRATGSVL